MPSQVYTCLGRQDLVQSVGRCRIAIPGNSESSGGLPRCRCYKGNPQGDEHSKDFDKKREIDDILGDLMPNNELNLSKKIHDWDVGDEDE